MEDKIIQKNVKLLLTKYSNLRNSILKKHRIWAYWHEFEDVNIGITERQFVGLTDGETISRACRKVLQDNPELRASVDLQQKSAELSEEHRKNYARE